MGQVRDLIGAQGAAAAGVLGPAEHAGLEESTIDDQLPAALEQVEQVNLTVRPVEFVFLLHHHPRHSSTFGGQRITGTGEGLLLHQKLSVCSLPFLLRHDRGHLHRDISFWALLVSLFGCCHIISPFVLRNRSRPLDLKSFLTLPVHTVRIPPADATPATITAVLSMHAGHICSSSEIRLSPFCIPPARYRLQANILKL